MTNWCQNKLVVTGAEERLGAWRSAQRGASPVYDGSRAPVQALTFGAQVPVPAAVLARGYSAGGLEGLRRALAVQVDGVNPAPDSPLDGASWQTLHWGSGRDAVDVRVTAVPGRLTLTFMTAWAAPLPWLEAVAALWPELTFELWGIEPGNELFVHVCLEGGCVTLLKDRSPTLDELLAWGYDVET